MAKQTTLVFNHNKTPEEMIVLLQSMLDKHLNYQRELGNRLMDVFQPHDQTVLLGVYASSQSHGLIYHDGELVGFIFVDINDFKLHVSEFYIDEPYRNQGIGQLVVAKLDQLAKDLDLPYITLSVAGANPAMSLYSKNGFVPRYIEMVKSVE